MSESAAVPRGSRARNLGRVLQLLHLDGPLARAALTESTGLNRSTVADLVGELERRGLAREDPPDPARRVGRPSPIVSIDARTVAIAINPEVDALTIGAVALDRSIPARERIDLAHPPSPAETAEIVGERLRRWRRGPLADAQIVGLGAAVPGLVRTGDGVVRDAPHLQWIDAAFGDLLRHATGLPVHVGNDASLGATAEHLFGAGRGVDDLVYLNGGASGIGGGLIIGGRPVGGAGGYAGEFGQNRPGIDDRDRRAPGGVLEDEVSRARLLSCVGLSTADEPTLAAALSATADEHVSAEMRRQRDVLATALANAVNVLNPSMVILGGFLATLARFDEAGLSDAVQRQSMDASSEGLQIRTAALAEDRLLIGAAEAAFAGILRDPTTA